MLFHALTQETLVAVTGSGCSAALGYPTWRELTGELLERAIDALRSAGSGTGSEELTRLVGFQERLASPPRIGSEELMFIFGLCQEALGGTSGEPSPYRSYLAERFREPAERRADQPNPYHALLRLPIYRFVTTNYDCELEYALAAQRSVPLEAFGIEGRRGAGDPLPLSFTQKPESCDQLAEFALARVAETRNMVFHCHGRFDDPESIIATELDYQKVYLTEEDGVSPLFLQTVDLLFQSNPILFVGYGLGDEDLLRPLRRLGAATPERKESRPLFALMPESSEGSERDYHDRLFQRFGLHVLPIWSSPTSDPQQKARSLCEELMRIEEDREEWRDSWFEKPTVRRVSVEVRPSQPYRHYVLSPGDRDVLGAQRTNEKLEELTAQAENGARVIALIGPGGTGKSWHAMRLLDRLQSSTTPFQGFFFWSSYYADDFITGLDRLLAYVGTQGRRGESRLTRLRKCLEDGRYLIVLDGLERLLHPTEDPETGGSNDPVVQRALEILSRDSRSTTVLTSRLWPKELDPKAPGIEKHELDRMQTGDLIGFDPYNRLKREEVSALCSLLGGHTYALLLAASLLRQGLEGELPRRLTELRRALAGTPPDRRLATVIGQVVASLNKQTEGLALALLEAMAVFMSPVPERTLQTCFGLALEARAPSQERAVSLEDVVALLSSSHLLFRMTSGPSELDREAYTVHPTVRSYVFQRAHRIERDVLPNFTLAGFTSGKAAVHPGTRDTAKLVGKLFDRLHREAVEELADERREEARQLCRSLFGVMRSRMETNTALRWSTYGEYIGFGLRLADLAKRLANRRWAFQERHELEELEDPEAPLYADELAFVYNDIGLTMCAEGYMRDTLAVWEQGYEINTVLEEMAEVPLFSLQSQLHLGHTFLEIGDLESADQYLDESARTNHKIGDPDYGARILGYQALVAHYRNHLEEAEEKYRIALRDLKRAGGNPRAESYFFSHRAKLAMVLGRDDRAERFLRASRGLAESGGALDLVAYARTAYGRWYRDQNRPREANSEYHAALGVARHFGIRRLEAEVLTGLARLASALGDAELARKRALAALAIANELDLGLRKTQALIVLGSATVQAGQPKLGIAYLELAKRMGDTQQYWLRSREAERKLQELGMSPEA